MKKILQGANKSCDSVVKENSELKKYVENIKQRYQQKIFIQEKNTLGKNNQKNIKKLFTKNRVKIILQVKTTKTI